MNTFVGLKDVGHAGEDAQTDLFAAQSAELSQIRLLFFWEIN